MRHQINMGRDGSGVKAASSRSIQISFIYNGEQCRERIKLKPNIDNLKKVERLKADIDKAIATNTFYYSFFFPNSKKIVDKNDLSPPMPEKITFDSDAQQKRFYKAVEIVVEKSFAKVYSRFRKGDIFGAHYTKIRQYCLNQTHETLKGEIKKLVAVSNIKPKAAEKIAQQQKAIKFISQREYIARQILSARGKLRNIEKLILERKKELNEIMVRLENLQLCHAIYSKEISYPAIPPPSFMPNEFGYPELEKVSGIYFIWMDNVIIYVGQSINLNQRLKLGMHEHIKTKAVMLSVLPVDEFNLTWTENYYIGVARPIKNYGLYKKLKQVEQEIK